jgi:hypothetical protein
VPVGELAVGDFVAPPWPAWSPRSSPPAEPRDSTSWLRSPPSDGCQDKRCVGFPRGAPQGRVARGRNPRAPPERSVTVSRHSAPAILIIRGFLTHAQWAK